GNHDVALVNAARRKLELLGMSGAQIDALTATGKAGHSFTVYSPYTGYVVTTTDKPGQNAGSPTMASAVPGNLIREGTYVSAGQTLFTVVDDSALRIELSLPGSNSIKEGTKAELYINGHESILTEV